MGASTYFTLRFIVNIRRRNMLQETMKTITDAEAQADELVKKARLEADERISAAKKKAADMIAAAGAKDKDRVSDAESRNKAEEEKLTVKALDLATAQAGRLKEKASSMEDAAIDMIIAELVGKK